MASNTPERRSASDESELDAEILDRALDAGFRLVPKWVALDLGKGDEGDRDRVLTDRTEERGPVHGLDAGDAGEEDGGIGG